jgi:hypothetical protein
MRLCWRPVRPAILAPRPPPQHYARARTAQSLLRARHSDRTPISGRRNAGTSRTKNDWTTWRYCSGARPAGRIATDRYLAGRLLAALPAAHDSADSLRVEHPSRAHDARRPGTADSARGLVGDAAARAALTQMPLVYRNGLSAPRRAAEVSVAASHRSPRTGVARRAIRLRTASHERIRRQHHIRRRETSR